MKKSGRFIAYLLLIYIPANLFSQTAPSAQTPPPATAYPIIAEYVCLFLPIVSTNSKTTTWNFSNTTSIGFATGINILYTDKFGFSFDLTPVVTTTNGTSKVSNLIFDPGAIFRLKKGFSIITRAAFESAGRFGESTVFSKVFSPAKRISSFLAVGVPIRFGNNLPASIGASLFFGVGFR